MKESAEAQEAKYEGGKVIGEKGIVQQKAFQVEKERGLSKGKKTKKHMQGWETTKRCKVHMTEKKAPERGEAKREESRQLWESMGKGGKICQGKDYTVER